jgi:YD repeat-containing protein
LGTGVAGAVRRIDSAYDTLGRLTTVTARSGVTATSPAVNQVTRAYNKNGKGQA